MMKKLSNPGKSLDKAAMKGIRGGNMMPGCRSGVKCSVYDPSTGRTHNGTCGYYGGNGSGEGGDPMTWAICECKTELGVYAPSSGTSGCGT